jgi:hypothetical protein
MVASQRRLGFEPVTSGHFVEPQPRVDTSSLRPDIREVIREPTMVALRKTDARPPRRPRPTGEAFDAPAAFEQARELYPKVMGRLAE